MNTSHRDRKTLAAFFVTFVLAATLAFGAAGAGQPAGPVGLLTGQGDVPAGLCAVVGRQGLPIAIELGRTGRFLVEVLDANAAAVAEVREAIRQAGLYGLVSAELLDPPDRLPYAEDLLNAVVLAGPGGSGVPAREVRRVLCPRGVVLAGSGAERQAVLSAAGLAGEVVPTGAGPWTLARKPRPDEMDDWTHPRHSAAGNAVSDDMLVGPPRRVKWVTGPSREISSMLSSGGRNYYGGLWARDAFNGLRLWDLPLTPSPARGNFGYRRTPGSVSPVAVGERLLAVTGGRLVAIDGATGRTVMDYPQAGVPTQILAVDGRLVVCDAQDLRALDERTGELCWTRDVVEPQHLVAGQGGVFFLEGAARRGEGLSAVRVDLDSGAEMWRVADWPWLTKVRNLVVGPGVLAMEVSTLADKPEGNAVHAVSADSGQLLWSREFVPGSQHMKQARAMFVGPTLWVLEYLQAVALDARTGQEQRRVLAGKVHCFPPAATRRYLFSGELELTDLQTGKMDARRMSKAACGRDTGWVPANGLIYLCPKHCVCWPIVRGYVALASERPGGPPREPAKKDFAPQAGPAPAPAAAGGDGDGPWPCYRGDAWRSGTTSRAIPAELKPIWSADLGGRPGGPVAQDWQENPYCRGPVTAPVVAGGSVFVARGDAHEVIALNAADGQVRWRFTANGRIDTPPTIHRGLCLFGTRTGWVFCLRADDGRLVWRLRAAPAQERIVAYGQVESPWPVAGSVLVTDGTAYLSAGRHPLADQGILVFAVEPASGRVKWLSRVDDIAAIHYRKYKTDPNSNLPAHRTLYACNALDFEPVDLMSREGKWVTMSRWLLEAGTGQMTGRHDQGFAVLRSGGKDVVVPRGAWTYGPRSQPRVGEKHPTRALCVWRDGTLWGSLDDRRTVYRRDFTPEEAAKFNLKWITGWAQSENARKKKGEIWREDRLSAEAAWKVRAMDETRRDDAVSGMLLAGDRLFLAGSRGGLTVLAAADGRELARCQTPPPAWDALAAGDGRILLTTQAGQVICLGAAP